MNIDPQKIHDNQNVEVNNSKKVDNLEKRVNVLDKKVKRVEIDSKKDTESLACDRCEKSFRNDSHLKKHKEKEHAISKSKYIIKCEYCSEVFDQTWLLEVHLSKHAEKCFKCEECEQAFHLEWRLNKHKEGHNDPNRKFCHFFNNSSVCPYQYAGCLLQSVGICLHVTENCANSNIQR